MGAAMRNAKVTLSVSDDVPGGLVKMNMDNDQPPIHEEMLLKSFEAK